MVDHRYAEALEFLVVFARGLDFHDSSAGLCQDDSHRNWRPPISRLTPMEQTRPHEQGRIGETGRY